MKNLFFAITVPFLLLVLNPNHLNFANYKPILPAKVALSNYAVNSLNPSIESEQLDCNRCGECTKKCILSEDACVSFEVRVANGDGLCDGNVMFGILFPGADQYICDIDRTSNSSWLVSFNIIAYACDTGNSGFINVPVQAIGFCFPGGPFNGSNIIDGIIPMTVC